MPPPLIAVDGLYDPGERPALRLHLRYADSVRAAGAEPVAVVPELDAGRRAAAVDALLDRVDGVLLGGGDDFHTEPLGLGPTHPEADPTPLAKQEFDLALAAAAVERGVPVLGICYGMQCLALAEGHATLLQHLPADRPGAREHAGGVVHAVRAEPRSKLAEALGVLETPVVSRHHQALDRVAAPWVVTARDEEGLVEGIERPDRPFAVGVQWHPELSPPDGPHGALFRAFVDAARVGAPLRTEP